jgi:hypothetical protein
MHLARLASRAMVLTFAALSIAESAAAQPGGGSGGQPGGQPPGLLAPQSLTAKFSTSGVQLTWSRVKGADRYEVNRAPIDHSNMLQIGVVLDSTLNTGQGTFTDANGQNTTSMYYVQVVDKSRRGGLARIAYEPPAAKAAEVPLKKKPN